MAEKVDNGLAERDATIIRLTRELDEARSTLAAADRGAPIYKAVERVLDEHSAWIARPSDDVTKAIALAAGVAWMAREPIDPSLEEIERHLTSARVENDKLRGLLWFAWYEFNAIRARSGAPLMRDGMTTPAESWWSQMTDAFRAAIGDDAKPWLSPSARAALKEIGNG